jgi:hypothetical protein
MTAECRVARPVGNVGRVHQALCRAVVGAKAATSMIPYHPREEAREFR